MAAVQVSIRDLPSPNSTTEVYAVTVDNEEIRTVVTKNASIVDHWVDSIYDEYYGILGIVGLDVEWNSASGPSSRVATLQLCIGRTCLIFQMIHADKIPRSLRDFLSDPNYKFVGVGVQDDVDKLKSDYKTYVVNVVDVRDLAAGKYGSKEVNQSVGLMKLAEVVLGCGEIEKSKDITLSNWDQYHLSRAQVQYACVDAYVSFKIGEKLF
ncbi:hypothetical protein MKW92_031198 [Papaver armeniacum]|nr:hypothetical protein MKW92_031198 [Papaver armeniacum]